MTTVEMRPVSRLTARLFDLSHAQLLEVAAAGCEASAEVKNRADAILAAHKPQPQRATARSTASRRQQSLSLSRNLLETVQRNRSKTVGILCIAIGKNKRGCFFI